MESSLTTEPKSTDNLIYSNKLIANQQKTAAMFNRVFVSAVQKLTQGRVMAVVLWNWQGDRGVAVKRLCSRPMMVMRGIGRRSGAGCDEVLRHLLSDCAEFIVETLTVLTNKYLATTAKFPDAINISKIVLVHKKSYTRSAANYRPVAVHSVFSNIFEIIFLNRLSPTTVPFLEVNNLLCQDQYGFRKGKSPKDSIFKMMNQV